MRRFIPLAGAAALGLAFAGSALASFVPHFAVSQVGTATRFQITIAKADDAPAHIVLYAPASETPKPIPTQLGE